LDLTTTQSQLQKMTENIPGLVYQFVLNVDGNELFTNVSPKCCELFGVEPEEILKDAGVFWQWIEPEDLDRAKEKVAHSAETLGPLDLEFRVAVPEQGVRCYNCVGQPQRQPNGDVV